MPKSEAPDAGVKLLKLKVERRHRDLLDYTKRLARGPRSTRISVCDL
jgi:hypothetical protein